MKGIIHFALTEFKLILRDKSFYFWAIVLPMFFIFVFSGVGDSSANKSVKIKLSVKNLDKGVYSVELIDYLRNENILLEKNLKEKKPERELIIPEGFSKRVGEGKTAVLKFKVKGRSLDSKAVQIKISLYRAVYKFLVKKYLGISKPEKILEIKSEWAGKASYIPSGVVHQLPATILMFILFNLLIYGGTNLSMLRERGMLKRFVITPMGKSGIWIGLFLTNIILAFIVSFILVLATIILFSVTFGTIPLLNMLVILIVFSFFTSSLSIYLGSVLKRQEAVVGVAVLVANLLAALGGCWWPIEIVPDFMKTIAMLLPTGWAMSALDKLLFYKYPFSTVLLHLLVLMGFTLIFAYLSIRYFKIERT